MPAVASSLILTALLILRLIYDDTYYALATPVPTSVARAREDAQKKRLVDGTCPSSESYCGTSNPPASNPGNEKAECGVYLAPSTLGNNSNLGIFTAIPLKAGQVVNYPEIAIPIFFKDFDETPLNSPRDGHLWDRYLWGGYRANIDPINDLNRDLSKSVFVPGVGCGVNSMLDLNNINSTHGSVYDTVSVPRGHPAAGSFTPYHESKTVVTRDVPVGSELLANYGDAWIPQIKNVAVTLNKHLDKADDFLQEYLQWVQKLKDNYNEEITVSLLERLWTMTTALHDSRDFSVLPKELDWKTLSSSSRGDSSVESINTRDYWRAKGIRSIEWLNEHGRCQDHIKSGPSTIPNAGRGAFASRYLPKNTVVGYAPLIHIGEAAKELLQWTYNKHTTYEYSKQELVINYSFGHADSTLLLTPYGAGVNYINHASSPYKPNVQIRWPNKEMLAHKPDWLHKNVEYLRDTTDKVGLSFEYVALRDIMEGEEIFMDYGQEWQQAWDDHVANYHPPVDADTYVHSSKYPIEEFKTPQERQAEPYPPNLHTLCKPDYKKNKGDGKNYFTRVLRSNDRFVPCQVLERHPGPIYTVEMTISNDDMEETVIVQKVPHKEGVQLFDRVFSQDIHQPQAFRHHIYIPNDIFPESWKNNL